MEEAKEPELSFSEVTSKDMYEGAPLNHRSRPGIKDWVQFDFDDFVTHLDNSATLFRYFMSFELADSEMLTNRYIKFGMSKFLDSNIDTPDVKYVRDPQVLKMELMDQVPIVERKDF